MKYAFLVTFLFLGQSLFSQVKAIEEFLDEHEDIKRLFLYQSNMRILNQENDPDFNRLIKNIKKINIYLYRENNEVSDSEYIEMTRNLRDEGFEDLMTLRSGEFNVNLLLKENKKDPLYVCSANTDEEFLLLEMDGYLDLKYINALSGLDFETLKDMVESNN